MDIQLKNEYLTNFKVKTIPLFKQGIRSLYDSTLHNNRNKKQLLKEFQETLANIPQWNTLIIDNEYTRFLQGSSCTWLGDLIMAVFKATIKELMIFRTIDPQMDVQVPSPKVFIHSCYIQIARYLWKKPQLLYHKYDKETYVKAEEELDHTINNAIHITINKFLPFESIVSKYVKNDHNESPSFVNEKEVNQQVHQNDDKKEVNHDDEESPLQQLHHNDDEVLLEEIHDNDNEESLLQQVHQNDAEVPLEVTYESDEEKHVNDDDKEKVRDDIIKESGQNQFQLTRTSSDTYDIDEEINKSIKEVYIRDKIKRNEKKIRNVLGIKVDYDTLVNNPKKVRNYLLMENCKKWSKV